MVPTNLEGPGGSTYLPGGVGRAGGVQWGSSKPQEVWKGMVRCRGEYVPPSRCRGS